MSRLEYRLSAALAGAEHNWDLPSFMYSPPSLCRNTLKVKGKAGFKPRDTKGVMAGSQVLSRFATAGN